MKKDEEDFFPDINADANEITCIESLCLRCHDQGMTRLLLTKIPFFKEVVISSFECQECGHHDSCIQSGGCIQEKGVKFNLEVTSPQDLNRQVVKSEHAFLKIPQLDFEQPPSKKADITTVEGLLNSIVEGLRYLQEERRKVDVALAGKVEEFMGRLEALKQLKDTFNILLDDPSGNSFIENPFTPSPDPHLSQSHYTRTRQQSVAMGYEPEEEEAENEAETEEETNTNETTITDTNNQVDKHTDAPKEEHKEMQNPADEEGSDSWNFQGEVLSFATQCPSCRIACQTNMKMIDIPYFKQVVVMATVCDVCGHRDNEVKGGAGIEPQGQLISLSIIDDIDLNRDVLKSETAGVKIPELDFEMVGGTLGGRFTTVEGLLTQVKEQLSGKNPFLHGDSSDGGVRGKVDKFCEKLDEIITGKMRYVHLELDDPAGNSYIQNLHTPLVDPHLTTHHYARSHEQDDELGIHDMKLENY